MRANGAETLTRSDASARTSKVLAQVRIFSLSSRSSSLSRGALTIPPYHGVLPLFATSHNQRKDSPRHAAL